MMFSTGARINIDALARDLDVSPTPLREALARLESEGLVRRRPLIGVTAVVGSAVEEHVRIAQAINAGRPDFAESAMREHLIRARERHLEVSDS